MVHLLPVLFLQAIILHSLPHKETLMTIKKLFATLMVALAMLVFAQGCNTLRGAGQDIEEAGEAVEDAAD